MFIYFESESSDSQPGLIRARRKEQVNFNLGVPLTVIEISEEEVVEKAIYIERDSDGQFVQVIPEDRLDSENMEELRERNKLKLRELQEAQASQALKTDDISG